jgi:hypothetical protein
MQCSICPENGLCEAVKREVSGWAAASIEKIQGSRMASHVALTRRRVGSRVPK